jgi:D-serine deaminase-like pyridoxal phosphate-dependent protein
MDKDWYRINNVEDIPSPSLVVFPKRIEENIKLMIKIAGGAEKLRPHIKTHKIAEIINMQLNQGIKKFKCATLSEAELLAKCNAKDILLAMQLTGSNINRFIELMQKYPKSSFSTIIDNEESVIKFNTAASKKGIKVSLWLDINNGNNRTGINPNNEATLLYKKIDGSSNLIPKGLHVYDGHIRVSDFNLRKEICDKEFESVLSLKNNIELLGIKINKIVAGGTPSFPIHVKRNNIEVSPGTSILWDERYGSSFKDLKFYHAAVLIGSIISRPTKDLMCLNLGHKSVASEMSFPRLKLLNMENFKQISHSEEHLVLECDESEDYVVGSVCYAIPVHICPTVPKYKKVLTVINGEITGEWDVAARDYNTE